MKKVFFVLIFSLLFLDSQANSEHLKLANYYTFNLQFEKARAEIEVCKRNKKTKIQANYFSNYIDFLSVLLSHDKNKYEAYLKKSAGIFETIENLDKNSPYYLYSLAQIKFNNSILDFLFGNKLSSAWELYRSYKLFIENSKKYPLFIDNNKFKSIYNILFSSIPEDYKWITTSLGINSNLPEGLNGLKKYSAYYQKDSLLSTEPNLINSLMQMQFSEDKMKAHQDLARLEKRRQNLLIKYIYCLSAAANGKNDEIISFLEDKKQINDTKKIVFFDYLLAKAKLNKLNFDAELYFIFFLKKYKGENYLKSVYQKIAWINLLKGNNKKYLIYTKKVKQEGQLILEEDKQSFSEISKEKKPKIELLSARLLFDGAYYSKSLEVLKKSNYLEFSLPEKLEYKYRLARIYHKQRKLNSAIKFYKEAILLGSGLEYYFAPYSALNIAQIYKENGFNKQAVFYYKKALSINKGEYKSSIELKAKLGLKSLEVIN